MMEWMAWTLPTSLFFAGIGTLLLGMTAWQFVTPTLSRQGFLPIATTRGDRLFIGLLSSGWLHLLWLGFTDQVLWMISIACVVWMLVLMKWG